MRFFFLKTLLQKQGLFSGQGLQYPDIKGFSYDRDKDVELLFKYFSERENKAAKRKQFSHTVITRCIVTAVCTKTRNWDNDEYKKGVVESY